MLGELAFLGVALAKSANDDVKYKKKCSNMQARGAFRPINPKRNGEIFSKYYDDWYHGEGKYIPEEYHGYFKINGKAAIEYIKAMTSIQEIKEGLHPYFCPGIFYVDTYHPLANFYEQYDKKIQAFNETGEVIM